jgi:hypothetical protein
LIPHKMHRTEYTHSLNQRLHLHLSNIIGHSIAICPTLSTTALSYVEHHQLQHCHQHIAIITNPSEPRYLTVVDKVSWMEN